MSLNLHIGLPKTGTTYIQKSLYHSAKLISDELIYPDVGYYNQQLAMYAEIGDYLPWDTNNKRNRWLTLTNQLNRFKNEPTLISAEAFSALNLDGVKHVKKTGIIPETIIITVRTLEDMIPSFWQQNVKQGSTVELKDYVNDVLNKLYTNTGSQMYSYREAAKNWKQVYNDATIKVLHMDGKPKDNASNFYRLVGLSQEAINILNSYELPKSEQNLSLSYDECIQLMGINQEIDEGTLGKRARRIFLDSCFARRNYNEQYEKPKIPEEYLTKVRKMDDLMANNSSDYVIYHDSDFLNINKHSHTSITNEKM